MGASAGVDVSPPTSYMSVNEAAAYLGVKPWDVVRLVQTNQVDSITLVDASSLRAYAAEERTQ